MSTSVTGRSDRADRLRQALEAALAPTQLEIEDQSHLHAGHAGAADGRGHFRVRVVAAAFAGMRPLERHRLVFAAADELLKTDIHALSIEALTPDEATP